MEKIEVEKNVMDEHKQFDKLKKSVLFMLIFMVFVPFVMCCILMIKVISLEDKLDKLENIQNSQIANMEAANNNLSNKENIDNVDADNDTTDKTTSDEDVSENSTEQNTTDTSKKGYGKTVYLTFDDGPSANTDRILEILDKYNVKATFFVCGFEDEESFRRYKAIVDSGNAIGMHSYTHNYSEIYSSLEKFKEDVTKIQDVIFRATGVKTNLYRFPGGSANSSIKALNVKNCIQYLKDNGYTHYDWNVSSDDAIGEVLSVETLIANIEKHIYKWDTSIVLMHDIASMTTTVDVLPVLIEKLLNEGFELKVIDETTKPIQQILGN